MYQDWTRHLSVEEEKERFQKSILAARPVLDRLKDLMKEREISIDIAERGIKQFDVPNWDYKQAFNNGFKSCLEIVKKLIDLDQQKEIKTNE